MGKKKFGAKGSGTNRPWEDSNYCDVDSHLDQLSAAAATLYNFAAKLTSSKKDKPRERIFKRSISDLAKNRYRGRDRGAYYKGLRELLDIGLFQLHLKGERGKPNSYLVLSHKTWAAHHPGQCSVYTGKVKNLSVEDTKLEVRLRDLVNGVPFNWRILTVRALVKDDEAAVNHLLTYLKTDESHQAPTAQLPGYFVEYLRRIVTAKEGLPNQAPVATAFPNKAVPKSGAPARESVRAAPQRKTESAAEKLAARLSKFGAKPVLFAGPEIHKGLSTLLFAHEEENLIIAAYELMYQKKKLGETADHSPDVPSWFIRNAQLWIDEAQAMRRRKQLQAELGITPDEEAPEHEGMHPHAVAGNTVTT